MRLLRTAVQPGITTKITDVKCGVTPLWVDTALPGETARVRGATPLWADTADVSLIEFQRTLDTPSCVCMYP